MSNIKIMVKVVTVALGEVEGFYHTPRVLFWLDISIIKAYNLCLSYTAINLYKESYIILDKHALMSTDCDHISYWFVLVNNWGTIIRQSHCHSVP